MISDPLHAAPPRSGLGRIEAVRLIGVNVVDVRDAVDSEATAKPMCNQKIQKVTNKKRKVFIMDQLGYDTGCAKVDVSIPVRRR
jgi:hypothetical protein